MVEMVIKKQLLEGLDGINEEEIEKIIVAYEPVWSIGTGFVPNIEDIIKVKDFIETILPKNRFIYGGSVNDTNINELKSDKIEGYLLGGISLKPQQLKSLIDNL